MQNNISAWVLGVIAIVIVGGGVAYYATSNTNTKDDSVPVEVATMEREEGSMEGTAADKMRDQEAMEKQPATAASDEVMGMAGAGTYQKYDPALLANAATGKVVLFFRASWCPTCRTLDADIRAHLDAIPKGVTILDVDYDSSETLKRKYNVVYQHTFVQVNADGTQVAKWSGSSTLADLVKNIK